MITVSIHSSVNGKSFNMLMVRPTKTLARQELEVIKEMDIHNVVGWIMWEPDGQCDSFNSASVLSMDSREFDSYDVSYYGRY